MSHLPALQWCASTYRNEKLVMGTCLTVDMCILFHGPLLPFLTVTSISTAHPVITLTDDVTTPFTTSPHQSNVTHLSTRSRSTLLNKSICSLADVVNTAAQQWGVSTIHSHSQMKPITAANSISKWEASVPPHPSGHYQYQYWPIGMQQSKYDVRWRRQSTSQWQVSTAACVTASVHSSGYWWRLTVELDSIVRVWRTARGHRQLVLH